jgi:hypothetical protein
MYSSELNSFGKGAVAASIRGRYARDDSTITPGPGAYNAKLEVVKEHQASVRMGSAVRTTMNRSMSEMPGPGMYAGNLYSFGKDSKGVLISGKVKRDDSTLAPGPGAYNASVKEHGGAVRIGSSERKTFSYNNQDQPGPGMYSGEIYSFGKDAKGVLIRGKAQRNDSTLSPGPGAYNASLEVVKEHSGAIRMGSAERRTVSYNNADMPGPGMYAGEINTFGKDAKGVSIRGKPNVDYSTLSPGPGAYNAKLEVVKEHQASVRIVSAERATFKGGV